jgi:hypothetical protein
MVMLLELPLKKSIIGGGNDEKQDQRPAMTCL